MLSAWLGRAFVHGGGRFVVQHRCPGHAMRHLIQSDLAGFAFFKSHSPCRKILKTRFSDYKEKRVHPMHFVEGPGGPSQALYSICIYIYIERERVQTWSKICLLIGQKLVQVLCVCFSIIIFLQGE